MLDRTNLIILLVALIGAGGGFLAGQWLHKDAPQTSSSTANIVKPGDRRLDIVFTDLRGHSRRLSEWDGKLVLVNFWATWCSPCRSEMLTLDKAQTLYAAKGLQVVGIALDDKSAVQDYLQQSPVHYPILLVTDPLHDPSVLYGNTRSVLPYSLLIGRDGRILKQRMGEFNDNSLQQWLTPHL